MFKIIRVKGWSCPSKYILMKDGEPIIFANGRKRLSVCMQYLEGYDVDIQDKAVKRELDRYK